MIIKSRGQKCRNNFITQTKHIITSTLQIQLFYVNNAEDKKIDQEKNSLWISNLSNNAKAADLKALFVEFGKVSAAKVFTTRNANNPSCFGFVTMSDAASALNAKTKLDRTNFKGKVITIDTVWHQCSPSL